MDTRRTGGPRARFDIMRCVILESLTPLLDRFEEATGWMLKLQGACRAEVCVALPEVVHDGRVDVAVVAERLGMPLVQSDGDGLWALGPASLGGHVLASAVAPELELPDLAGRPFRLSSLLGKKVLVVSWAPY